MAGQSAALARTVRAYYAYEAASSLLFFWPVFVYFYQSAAGLSLPQIMTLQAYYTALRAAFDVPLGAVADRFGRRYCLAGSALGFAAGCAVLLLGRRLLVCYAAETSFALASALRSGANTALLYDTLLAHERGGEFGAIEGRAQSVRAIGSGLSAVTGGLLASLSPALPYAATLLAAAAGILAALLLHEPDRHALTLGESPVQRIGDGLVLTWRDADVRWLVGLYAVMVIESHVYFYLQQPYMLAVGVPVAFFGVVFLATKLLSAAVAPVAYRVDTRLGTTGTVTLMLATPIAGFLMMGLIATPIGTVAILTRGPFDGLWVPLLRLYSNRVIPSRLRATAFSIQSLIGRLGLSATIFASGILLEKIGPHGTFLVFAAAAAAACLLCLAGARRRLR